MLLLNLLKGTTKITRFKAEVGEGDPLWDDGWRVSMRKYGFIKFLVWTKPETYRYTVDDVATQLDVDAETVRRWCREGKLRFIKLPVRRGEYRFSEEDITELVNQRNK